MKIHSMFENGCIGEFFGSNDFVRVYPIFSIDKVKWSFVKKGQKDKSFDVYMDIDKFFLLTELIVSGKLSKKIEADTGQFPSAYKYVGGENGSRELAIGKSSKGGVLIQGRDKSKNLSSFVPVNYEDLYIMALWYKRVTGEIECRNYYAVMAKLFWDGYNNSATRRSNRDNDAA